MDRNAYRDEVDGSGGGAEQPDDYWRRRVITLALGLGLLGILAWIFSGGGGKPVQSGSSGAVPAAAIGTGIPGLADGTSATSPSTAAGSSPPSVETGASPSSATPSDPATPSASRASGAARSQERSPVYRSPGSAASSGGRCGPGAVVLSLFTDRTSYGPSQYPRFDVYAVSTSAGSCAFDPGQLQLVVLSAGRIVWDSADCGHDSGRVVELARGVPAQHVVVWNRAITLPGCQVLAPSARLGSYSVQAQTATVHSPARTFKLTG